MNKDELIKKAMSELGKRSAKKRKNWDYKALGKKGAAKRWNKPPNLCRLKYGYKRFFR